MIWRALFLVLFFPSIASAASLNICWQEVPSGISKAPAFIAGNPLSPDLLPGSILSGTKRCGTTAIPATLIRGQNYSITMKFENAIGEVSAPSNGISFLDPLAPPVPTLLEVQIVSP